MLWKRLNAKQDKEKTLLLYPKSKTFPAFDAFLCIAGKWMPLQITINGGKVLDAKLLLEFFNEHPGVERCWYGVVRPVRICVVFSFRPSLNDMTVSFSFLFLFFSNSQSLT